MTDKELIQEAADLAVKKFFTILGVDMGNPKEVEDFREDLRFGRRLRKAAAQGMVAFIGLIALGIGAVIWEGVLSKLGHK